MKMAMYGRKATTALTNVSNNKKPLVHSGVFLLLDFDDFQRQQEVVLAGQLRQEAGHVRQEGHHRFDKRIK